MTPFRALAFCMIVLAPGCTPTQWVRADVTAEQAEMDEADCQRQAWHEANLRTFSYHGPFYRPFGRPWGAYPGPFFDPYGNRMLDEAQLSQFCMRNKGYRLEPTQ